MTACFLTRGPWTPLSIALTAALQVGPALHQFVEIPNGSHSSLNDVRATPETLACARHLIEQALQAPERLVDDSCTQTVPPIDVDPPSEELLGLPHAWPG